MLTAHWSCVWQMAMGYTSRLLDWDLFCARGHLSSNQVLNTPELSFTSFQTSLLLSGGGVGGEWWLCNAGQFQLPPSHFSVPSISLSLPMLREKRRETRAHWPSKTPIGTKDKAWECSREGQGKKNWSWVIENLSVKISEAHRWLWQERWLGLPFFSPWVWLNHTLKWPLQPQEDEVEGCKENSTCTQRQREKERKIAIVPEDSFWIYMLRRWKLARQSIYRGQGTDNKIMLNFLRWRCANYIWK